MSGDRPVEVIVYEMLKARLDKDDARAHLLVRRLSRRDLLAFVEALAGITLESLTEILAATGHDDPAGFVRRLLERSSEQAVDRAVSAQTFEDPPPFLR